MKKTIIWGVISCLMIAALLLASCAPATPTEEKPSPSTEEKPAPKTEEKPAAPAEEKPAKAEMVTLKLTKTDGTVVQKTVEKPKYGGVLTMTRGADPVIFDEAFGGQHLAWTLHFTNEGMVDGNWAKGPAGTGEASWLYFMFPPPHLQAGYLAESWEIVQPDTIIWHIRKGVHFHNKPPVNGREMTADDVVFSLKRLLETPTSYNFKVYPKADFWDSITATDKWTVVCKIKPGKLGIMFEKLGDFSMIVPPEPIQKFGDMQDPKNGFGTGPFMLTDYVRGSSITFVRNPNYWMKDPLIPENKLPYLDGVKLLIVPDTSTRMAALRTGKIDHLGGWGQAIMWEDAASLLKTNPELQYLEYYGGGVPAIQWRVDKPELPFCKLEVRRALSMAIDRKELIDTYYGGKAELLGYPIGPIPEFMDMYTPIDKLPQSARELFEYNPDKAKQLLAEAGYPNGFKAEIICVQGHVDLLSIAKAYWAKIGVDLSLDVKEAGVFTSMQVGHTYKQAVIHGDMVCTMPYSLFYEHVRSVYNGGQINDARINQAYDDMATAYFDEAKKRQIMKDLSVYIIDQAYHTYFPGPYHFTIWQPWLKGYHGEFLVGYGHYTHFPYFVWLDQDLKEEMIGHR